MQPPGSVSDNARDLPRPPDAGAATPVGPGSAGLTRPRKLTPLACIAGLIAGILAWGAGEPFVGHYQPSKEAAEAAYAFTRLNQELSVANSRNGAIAFGILGGLLGAAAGLAGGLAAGRPRRGATAAALGFALGGLAGALPAFGIIPIQFEKFTDPALEMESYFLPLMVAFHFGLWGPLGGVCGIAMALGYSGSRAGGAIKGLVGGLVGVLLGTVVYEMVGALAFPADLTSDPISVTGITRLLARLCVALGAALGAAAFLSEASRRARNVASAPGIAAGEAPAP